MASPLARALAAASTGPPLLPPDFRPPIAQLPGPFLADPFQGLAQNPLNSPIGELIRRGMLVQPNPDRWFTGPQSWGVATRPLAGGSVQLPFGPSRGVQGKWLGPGASQGLHNYRPTIYSRGWHGGSNV
jgi:hypothetical protein